MSGGNLNSGPLNSELNALAELGPDGEPDLIMPPVPTITARGTIIRPRDRALRAAEYAPRAQWIDPGECGGEGRLLGSGLLRRDHVTLWPVLSRDEFLVLLTLSDAAISGWPSAVPLSETDVAARAKIGATQAEQHLETLTLLGLSERHYLLWRATPLGVACALHSHLGRSGPNSGPNSDRPARAPGWLDRDRQVTAIAGVRLVQVQLSESRIVSRGLTEDRWRNLTLPEREAARAGSVQTPLGLLSCEGVTIDWHARVSSRALEGLMSRRDQPCRARGYKPVAPYGLLINHPTLGYLVPSHIVPSSDTVRLSGRDQRLRPLRIPRPHVIPGSGSGAAWGARWTATVTLGRAEWRARRATGSAAALLEFSHGRVPGLIDRWSVLGTEHDQGSPRVRVELSGRL